MGGLIGLVASGGLTAVRGLLGALVRCRPCLAVVAAIALVLGGAVYGVHVERARTEARIAAMKQAAERAAHQRDADIRGELEGRYGPVISQLKQQALGLQKQVDAYGKRKPTAARGDVCKLGADALRLRSPPPG